MADNTPKVGQYINFGQAGAYDSAGAAAAAKNAPVDPATLASYGTSSQQPTPAIQNGGGSTPSVGSSPTPSPILPTTPGNVRVSGAAAGGSDITSPYFARSPFGTPQGDQGFTDATKNITPTTPPTAEDIYSKLWGQSQGILDALQKSEQATEAAANTASEKATSGAALDISRGGLGGSTAAAKEATAIETDRGNAVAKAQADQATAVANLGNQIRQEATAQANYEKENAQSLSADYIKTKQATATNWVKSLAQTGHTIDELQQSDPQTYNTLVQYYGGNENTLKADWLAAAAPTLMNNGQPVSTQGDKATFLAIDPVTKLPKAITITADTPLGGAYKAVSTAFGVVTYNTQTGEASVLNGDTGGAGGGASSIADAIANGSQPPVLTGLYKASAAVRAELAAKGVNLSKLQTEWTATQAYTKNLNSTQQIRLRQSIDAVSNSVNMLDTLNTAFDRYGVRVANKADLMALSQGLNSQKLPEPFTLDNGTKIENTQQLAQAFLTQTTLITDQLGGVFMGGNSPTDKALGLAQGVMGSDFTKEQMATTIGTLKQDLTYRANAIDNVGVGGLGGENPYAQNGGSSGSGQAGAIVQDDAGNQYQVGSDGQTLIPVEQ